MKTLTAKEEEIMGYFWEKGPLFVKQIFYLHNHVNCILDYNLKSNIYPRYKNKDDPPKIGGR